MNIFYSDRDPVQAARNLDSRRLVKMVLESAQLLSTSLHHRGRLAPYRPTHQHHPCAVAVQDDRANYDWLLAHFRALCQEYRYRFGREHACHRFLRRFARGRPAAKGSRSRVRLPNCTKFPRVRPLVVAYRAALLDKWLHDERSPRWSGPCGARAPPAWALAGSPPARRLAARLRRRNPLAPQRATRTRAPVV